MNDDKIVVQEVIRVGSIPDNMIYWSKPIGKDDPWSERGEDCMPWEIEVNFD